MTPVREARIAGYHRALTDHGLGAGLVLGCADDKQAGLDAENTLRRDHPDVSAVVCNGDMVALGACLALQRNGMVPGRDLSVIGFDDVADAAVATPPLTTMAVAPYHLGRKLARTLLDRLADPTMPVAVSEVSADLVVRGTTGPPPAQ